MKTVTIDGKEYSVESSEVDGKLILTPIKEVLFPQKGDGYWFVQGDGMINADTYYPTGSDLGRVAHFNVYRTEELAERASKMQRISNALIMAKLEIEPEYEPVRDGVKISWVVYSDLRTKKLSAEGWKSTNYLTPVYSSVTKAIEAIAWLEAHGIHGIHGEES